MDTIAIIGPKGIPKDFPGTTGIEAYIEYQIPRLIQMGNVSCYVRSWATSKDVGDYHGVRIIRIPSINTKFFDAISYSLIASIHASFTHSTIVWYHGIGPSFFAFIPKLFQKRVYITVHSLDWRRSKWNTFAQLFLRGCERMAISFSDKMFVVSTQLKTYYQNRYHKETVVDKFPIIKHSKIPANIIRQRYHLTKNGYILYLGRFVPEKRIDWLIRASSKIPNIPIVIAGGSSHADMYERFLRTTAKKRPVIFTGYIFGKEKAELFSNCKLFVLPSQLEGYPISVAEALGYGKRCLIGDFLKPEYARNNRLIHYFKFSDYRSFARGLKNLSR